MAAKINMRLDKNEMPSQDPNVRNKNFLEVALGYTEEQALDEAARCLHCKNHPCVDGCPVNVRIPEFIAKIVERDYEGAYQVIHQTSSLPAVCGRVCPQESQCEMHCVRGKKGDPVGIGRLERFVADWHNAHSTEAPEKPQPNGHKVAVVGSGPAGLTCAGDLAKKGYEVTVFEALHLAGGVLVYGIPEFRLPKSIVQKEVDGLKAMLLASCTPANRVVENPLIGAANTMTLDFPKIELSDTATVLHVDAYFRPHNCIRIDAGTYLLADGQKYMLQGSEGILPDSLFWMPDSGEASFVLKFGPLPRGTKSFDFIESDCDDCFKLYGVDLTGKKEYPRYPEGLPRALRKAPEDGPVPEPILAVGTTTVNVRLLGYRRGMVKEVAMYVNSLLNGQEEHTAAIDPESGTATLRFEQYGTAMAYVSCGPVFGMCWIAPGETLDMYIAMEAGGRAIVQRRDKECEPAPGRRLYTTGAYADLNALVDASGGSSIRMNLYSGDFADYRMSADEYTQMVVSKYEILADSIARSPVSGMMKELSLLTLQQEALGAMSNGPGLLEHNYRSRHEDWDYGKKVDYEFAVFAPEHYTVLAGLFDLNNPKLLMGMSSSDYCYSIIAPHIGWANIAHATEGILADLPKVYQLPSKAENNALTQEDLDLLHSLKEPFYAEACEAMQARVRKELESVKDVRIETTPEVAVDKLFDAIVAPYKGKVVFVDFWNTWCGPCRASIKANEPLKSGELKSDDLVWIYIANETSPLVAYKTSIAKIAGKHYRLDDAQWKYLCEKFQIDGIPSYVLVDRDGSYELRNDFRDHDLMKKTLKGMLE